MSDPLPVRTLSEAGAGTDPYALFDGWFAEARAASLPQPEAMTLCTVGEGGQPTARTVLLKEFSPAGFAFYTNYRSHKGAELERDPRATLLFFWSAHERQVRIEGSVVRLPAEEADAYFRTRPRESQIGAWASPQSQVLPDRAALEARFAAEAARFEGAEVPRPPHWGGYRLVPSRIEFWQGRPGRLHDRILFAAGDGGWSISRLAP